MKSKDIAKLLFDYYPVQVDIEDSDWGSMETLRASIEDYPSGDGLFDFVVKEIGKERSKKDIISLLKRAVNDLEVLIEAFEKIK